ncbi:hypothetical protein BDV24DRAFT_128747 [Aspergillus arachidicola]|uniref:Uncharacterized protein n=1 Tax=Aspergillus arachidicola TaxID=656916 RepID=A0A5N6YGT4_9EURO|nr:hypothetical protein BDV24DRAFT_128747 [Aspergillus arachidicola]
MPSTAFKKFRKEYYYIPECETPRSLGSQLLRRGNLPDDARNTATVVSWINPPLAFAAEEEKPLNEWIDASDVSLMVIALVRPQ